MPIYEFSRGKPETAVAPEAEAASATLLHSYAVANKTFLYARRLNERYIGAATALSFTGASDLETVVDAAAVAERRKTIFTFTVITLAGLA